MRKNLNIEIHNEEVKEIMGSIPGWTIRWGLTVIFLICSGIIVGSYFFSYPKVVSVPMVITTENPPARLISKTSGRIKHWVYHDGEHVLPQSPVALINNTANYNDIIYVDKLIKRLDSLGSNQETQLPEFREKLELGELQEYYGQLLRNSNEFSQYLHDDFLTGKILLEEAKLKQQEESYKMMLEQKALMEEELKIEEKTFSRYKPMMEKGGVSESQTDQAKARLMQTQRNFIGFKQSIKNTESNLLVQQRTLIDLREQRKSDIRRFEMDITDNLRTLKNGINNWKDRYMICSPISGKLTLDNFWSENHVIQAGECLATIVPPDSVRIICKAIVPASGIGEIQPGQKVNIKLSGFPFMEYGILSGKVVSISLVPVENEYTVFIGLENMISSYSEHLKLIQEMDGTAEIVTQNTRAIYRFIQPLRSFFK